jgi:hypothetical protein
MKKPNLPIDFLLLASKFYIDNLGDFKRGSPLLNYLENDYGSFSDDQQIHVKENFEFWDGDTLSHEITLLANEMERIYNLGKDSKNEKK